MKTIEIKGVTFELQNKEIVLPIVERHPHRTIWDCYNRPSDTKVSIYESWLRYATEVDAYGFTVSSYNCHFFSLEFQFTHDGIRYHARITPCHNYLYKIA